MSKRPTWPAESMIANHSTPRASVDDENASSGSTSPQSPSSSTYRKPRHRADFDKRGKSKSTSGKKSKPRPSVKDVFAPAASLDDNAQWEPSSASRAEHPRPREVDYPQHPHSAHAVDRDGYGHLQSARDRLQNNQFDESHHQTHLDPNVHNRNRSNSHELTWRPQNARSSVVDNMLLSFDGLPATNEDESAPQTPRQRDSGRGYGSNRSSNFSYGGRGSNHAYSTSDGSGGHPYSPNGNGQSYHGHSNSDGSRPTQNHHAHSPSDEHNINRSRGYTGSSVSSDDSQEGSRKYRNNRSNSVTNFQSSLSRIDSVRRVNQQDQQSNIPESPHRGGKNGRKANHSIDNAEMSPHRPPRIDSRGQSFDASEAGRSPYSGGKGKQSFDNGDPQPTRPFGASQVASRTLSGGKEDFNRSGVHKSFTFDGAASHTKPTREVAHKSYTFDVSDVGRARGDSLGSSNSFDIARSVSTKKWQKAAERRRSSDFDQSPEQSQAPTTQRRPVPASINTAKAVLYFDDIEAAPTPTVPSGPSRLDSPPNSATFRPDSSLAGGQQQSGSSWRRNSIRAPAPFFTAKGNKNDTSSPDRAWSGKNSPRLPRQSQTPLDLEGEFDDESVNYSQAPEKYPPKPKSTTSEGLSPVNPPKEKEKPGFFKKIFGGGSRNNSLGAETSTPTKAPKAPESRTPQQAASQASQPQEQGKKGKESKPGPPPKTPTKEKVPAKDLNKKASFFRRRKKSVADTAVPVPPLELSKYTGDDYLSKSQSGDQSPVSSLRQVMTPYLTQDPAYPSSGSEAPFPPPSLNTQDRYDGSDVEPLSATSSNPNRNTIRPVHSHSGSDVIMLPTPTHVRSPTTDTDTDGEDAWRESSRGDIAGEFAGWSRVPPHTRNQSEATASKVSRGENTPRKSTSASTASHAGRERSATHRSRPSDRLASLKLDHDPRPWITAAHGSPDEDDMLKTPKRTVSGDGRRTFSSSRRGSGTSTDDFRSAVTSQSPEGREDEMSLRQPGSAPPQPAYSPPAHPLYSPPAQPMSAPPQPVYDLEPAHPLHSPPPIPISASFDKVNFGGKEKPEEQAEEHAAAPDAVTENDRSRARELFDGDSDLDIENLAAYLGDDAPGRARLRRAYLDLFEFKNLSILAALRRFCGQLKLRGETQQVDRLLDALSVRWVECNPRHGFKDKDVVHTICYSILLLNTDLHLADIDQKMTRNQFVKNTMPTIRRVVLDAAPNSFDKPPSTPARRPSISEDGDETAKRPVHQLTHRPSDHSASDATTPVSINEPEPFREQDCGPLVRSNFYGKMSSWEALVDQVLRNIYSSIRSERLPLFAGKDPSPAPHGAHGSSQVSLTVSHHGPSGPGQIKRTNSLLSKTGSDHMPLRGRPDQLRGLMGSRWSSKTRSRPRLHPNVLSSRMSFDDEISTVSPSSSSMWSKYSYGKTQTSMSVNSLTSHPHHGDYQQSIGFANALSQAIIREETAGDSSEELMRTGPLLEDESLELEGAPWAKEGILKHKHHLEAVDKKAKDRAWVECFAVVEKGYMSLFRFNVSAKSLRNKSRGKLGSGSGAGGMVVGGGNWTENAEPLGRFLLRQSIASALPPPGYSRARPHVWALSLPNGAVHLFQANTPEIVKEFVSTANYWSARMSKEPLVGAVSNVEYGWGESAINPALVQPLSSDAASISGVSVSGVGAAGHAHKHSTSSLASAGFPPAPSLPPPGPPHSSSLSALTSAQALASALQTSAPSSAAAAAPRPSLQNSIRSSFDQAAAAASGAASSSLSRPKLPGDRVHLSDWTPPAQSMLPSALLEVDQLRALSAYVGKIEGELKRHNELRAAVALAFSPRHPNYAKAMGNWERKSAYLLREIVKFSTYIDALREAGVQKERVERDREERERIREMVANS